MNTAPLRRAYHRLWWGPRARSVLTGRFFGRQSLDTTHLHAYPEGSGSVGPVQREEALVLFALIRALRPQTVVEFGFHEGRSAFNILRALDPAARLYSYDVGEESAELAAELFAHDARFTFHLRSQSDFEPADVEGRPVDFVFLHASHAPATNRETFRRVLPVLAPDALVAVHDTGTVLRSCLTAEQQHEANTVWPDRWLSGDVFEHQPGERATVNWLRDEHPEFAQIHLHTHAVARWGLTIGQRSGRLTTSAEMPPS